MDGINQLTLGPLATNCYLVPAADNSVVVVDPAASSDVSAFLETGDLSIAGIVITHGHFDHFAGVAALRERYNAAIYAPELDREMFQSSDKCWAFFMGGIPFAPITPDYLYEDGDEFDIGGVRFRVKSAPGHTAGSCLLFCEQFGALFTGDVLFKNGCGRTDGFSGSARQMDESLKMISGIQGDYQILCGHGETSTLVMEKKFNPYLSGVL